MTALDALPDPEIDRSRWGLSESEARARLAADGPNELPRSKARSIWRIVASVLREPMLALLLAAGLVYLLLGDRAEALILLGFATLSIAISVIQEARTERVLEALRDLSAPRALVVREGRSMRIAGREVVREDILILEQGDRVAADAVLLEAMDLEVDESLLTGESLPVAKSLSGPSGEVEPARIYAGTLVARGGGVARATATGIATEIGKIGQSLARLEFEPSTLRRQTATIVRLCAIGAIAVAVAVVLLYGLLRGVWLEALLAGIAVGMSMLPEEFPVVLTIFLAMGAWRIGQAGVLARRSAAIETLGAATVLCSDKTGTLTENRMALAEMWLASGEGFRCSGERPIPPAFHTLVEVARLASPAMPSDPMELALLEAEAALTAPGGLTDRSLAKSHGLSPELLATTNVWTLDGAEGFLVATKGAPEAIALLCQLSPEAHRVVMAAVDEMAARGIRVLGVATATHDAVAPAASPRDYRFELAGLVGLADPLRPGVPAAVAECRAAGIKVVMITGDHAATARAIAREAGIAEGEVLTGAELDALDESALSDRLEHISVYARILPQQKLRIVEAMKANGEIVAMTGDGVNDAPSLKAANIGVAMGKRGTDVAREAASIVLLDDDFGTVVHAIRLGRRIYDNIRKAVGFIFSVHVPIAGLAILPFVAGLPLILGPIHIALIELIIDPVCALAFEAEPDECDVMRRKPRSPSERLLDLGSIGLSVLQGGLAFLMCGAICVVAANEGAAPDQVRALGFFSLIAGILVLIFVNRSFGRSIVEAFRRSNRRLYLIVSVVVAVVAAILISPGLRGILQFGPLYIRDLALITLVAVLLLVVLEQLKMLSRAGLSHRLAKFLS
jgi:Ca2+-transporting ATPase